jgi:hypothetical protein
MSESIVLSVFWGLFLVCSNILLLSGSIIFLKRNKDATAYLLLIGSVLSTLSCLIPILFAILAWVISFSTKTFLFISFLRATITAVGLFCFAIGFYKLVRILDDLYKNNE